MPRPDYAIHPFHPCAESVDDRAAHQLPLRWRADAQMHLRRSHLLMKNDPRSASMPFRLIRSKFMAPVSPPQLVSRPRIVDRVFQAVGAKLILVRAPAGFGKTTLMLELKERYERDGANTAWLHLDDADNDVARLLACLEEGLQGLLSGDVFPAADGIQGAPGLVEQAITLIDRIAAVQVPFVLFIDEFEVLKAPAVIGLLSEVLARLPRGSQLVIGTRSVPDIGLGRLRARGQLVEVDPEQLRMTEEETRVFITQRRGLTIKPSQVQRLRRSTEGWIAALSLAATSLERREDRDAFIAGFTGSNADLADYLAEDVLSGQPDPVREFLLNTSMLDSLTVPLCNAVMNRQDSAEMLALLERANLFLLPLDSDRVEYRYHSLFSAFLRNQLARQAADRLPLLHRRAADWYLAQDRPISAIRHAISTQDWPFAAATLSAHANRLMEQGRLRPLCHALDALPASELEKVPQLRIIHAWATLFSRGAHRAQAAFSALPLVTAEHPEFEEHRLALEPLRLGMLDRLEEAYQTGVDYWPRQRPELGFPYRMSAQALSLTCMMLGRHAEALKYIDDSRRTERSDELGFSAQISEYVESAIELSHGRLKQATARIRAAAGTNNARIIDSFNRNAMPGLLLAEVLYEANDLAAAERLLRVYTPLVRDLGLSDQLIVAHTLLARIVADAGDDERALMLLADLESVGHRLELPRVVGSARLERARLAILRNDVEHSRLELDRAGDPGMWDRVEKLWCVANDVSILSIGRLRHQIRSGAAARAADRAKQAAEEAEKAGRQRRALKLRILHSEALHRSGQPKPALRVLGRALEFAASEGFVRTFLEEGPYVESMVQEALAATGVKARTGEGADQLQAFADRLRRSRVGASPAVSAQALSDPLTSKETRVLELLAEGLGNQAIGDRMFVSESTVRAHLRSINTKLQASNRVQALVIARRLGVVA